MVEVAISLAESIPSATTARLPDRIPTIILIMERNKLPNIAYQDAFTMVFCLWSKLFICKNSRIILNQLEFQMLKKYQIAHKQDLSGVKTVFLR